MVRIYRNPKGGYKLSTKVLPLVQLKARRSFRKAYAWLHQHAA